MSRDCNGNYRELCAGMFDCCNMIGSIFCTSYYLDIVYRHGLTIGDVDNDGDNELVVGTAEGELYIFKVKILEINNSQQYSF